jgi:cell division protein ZapA (FtsZ GTPase activity inhibitor)
VDKKKFIINIKIDGRNYPLQIDRENEEKYRIAAKNVNETIRKYREMFGDMEPKDILAMSAFQIALSNAELQQRESDTLFIDELRNINDDISDFLKEKKKI